MRVPLRRPHRSLLPRFTGRAIGSASQSKESENRPPQDASSICRQLEDVVVPLPCRNLDRFIKAMRHAIVLNASHFNTQRMLTEYIVKACFE
jgi:starch phosphorylase